VIKKAGHRHRLEPPAGHFLRRPAQIVTPFVSYLIYQWDINIRLATIISFAGGGIGLTLTTFFGSLQYHKAGTVVAFIVLVVALME